MRKCFLLVVLLLTTGVFSNALAQDTNPPFVVEDIIERPFITSIVWASDGRMFWTEKDGIVGLQNADGTFQAEPVVTVPVMTGGEQGLQSIALDPAFDENGYFYIYYTTPASPTSPNNADVLTRFQFQNGTGINPLEMLRVPLPENDLQLHNGGRIRFSEVDGFMYLSIGDLGRPAAGQDFNILPGKIHRYTVVGNQLVPAPNNPFPGNSMWAMGLRNTFSFAFDPGTNNIFATENGPDCDDEINLILPNGNYGWTADIDCEDDPASRQSNGLPPLISWTPTISPTGILIYDGAAFPDWQGQLFYCSFKLGELRRQRLNTFRTRFEGDSVLVPAPPDHRCHIEVAQSPEGYIYYSNQTGMFRLVPQTGG